MTANQTNGSIASITNAIEALHGARMDWVHDDKVFAALGIALRHLRAAETKAEKQAEKTK